MKKTIFFLIMSITTFCYSQESQLTFMNDLCEYKTDGTGKSLGLEIKFVYPCKWESLEGNRPHILRKFNYVTDGNTVLETITMNKIDENVTQSKISEMFTDDGMRDLANSLGTYISCRNLKIDGIETAEITYKAEQETVIGRSHMYYLMYLFVYEHRLITITFMTGSLNDTVANSLFDKYKLLFYLLAGKTIVLSQWND